MSLAQVGGKKVIIIGGGLSGLCFLHYLRTFAIYHNKQEFINKITLLEANDYMGGSIKSKVFDDGVIHELGPRGIRTQGVKACNTGLLLEELGLSDKVMTITEKSSAGKYRHLYVKDEMFKLAIGSKMVFKKIPGSNSRFIKAFYNDLFKAPKINVQDYPYQDPPLYDFIKHRFGEDVAENIADPVMRGITSGDVRKLSTKALFSDFLLKEQHYGSVIGGMLKPPVSAMTHDDLYPRDFLKSKLLKSFTDNNVLNYNLSTGLQTLPEHLSNSLLNTNDDGKVSIYNSTKVRSISFPPRNTSPGDDLNDGMCSVFVDTVDGGEVELKADHIVAALPANHLAEILPSESMPAEQRGALEFVGQIEHAPVACVTVEYRNLEMNKLPKFMNSFGYLTHSKSGSRVLGVAFDSAMFPQIGSDLKVFRMTAMIGGAWCKEVLGTDGLERVTNAQLEEIALEEIRGTIGIKQEPHRLTTALWKTGIAQYRPGHKDRLVEMRNRIKELSLPITLLGQSYDGVAVNDVTFGARLAANDFVKSLGNGQ